MFLQLLSFFEWFSFFYMFQATCMFHECSRNDNKNFTRNMNTSIFIIQVNLYQIVKVAAVIVRGKNYLLMETF